MKELMQKIKTKIDTDDTVRKQVLGWGGYWDAKKTITYRTLENAAGNHLFDDHPEFFDITEREGSIIRATFQESAFLKDNWKQNLIDWGIVDS